MRRSLRQSCFVALVAAFSLGGCDNGGIPVSPTPTLELETFSGSLTQNGATVHDFVSGSAGTITVTLTDLEPDDTTVGLSLGTWNGTSCQVILANDAATVSAFLTGATQTAASLCVRLYDAAGALTGTVGYTVQVEHPE